MHKAYHPVVTLLPKGGWQGQCYQEPEEKQQEEQQESKAQDQEGQEGT